MKAETLKFICGLIVGFILTFLFIEIKNSLANCNGSHDEIIKKLSMTSSSLEYSCKTRFKSINCCIAC